MCVEKKYRTRDSFLDLSGTSHPWADFDLVARRILPLPPEPSVYKNMSFSTTFRPGRRPSGRISALFLLSHSAWTYSELKPEFLTIKACQKVHQQVGRLTENSSYPFAPACDEYNYACKSACHVWCQYLFRILSDEGSWITSPLRLAGAVKSPEIGC